MNNEYYGVNYLNRKKIEKLLNIAIEDNVQDWELEVASKNLKDDILYLLNSLECFETELLLLYIYSIYDDNNYDFFLNRITKKIKINTFDKLFFYFYQVNDIKAEKILSNIFRIQKSTFGT